jgi:serine protease AprX
MKLSIGRFNVLVALLVLSLAAGGWSPVGLVSAAAAPTPADDPSGPHDRRLSPKIDRVLRESGADERIPVIVTTGTPDIDEASARASGASIRRRFRYLDGFAASIPARGFAKLLQSRSVRGISYDAAIHPLDDLDYVTVGGDIALRNYNLTGKEVAVAVLDSGVAKHGDLGARLLAEVEIVGHESGFVDLFGHGTHVAGIIAGNAHASSDAKSFRRIVGMGKDIRLVSVRIFGPEGTGLVSDALAGIDWIIANKDKYKIRVLNASFGHPVEESYLTDPLCQAVERAWKAGIVVVASAGNDGALGYGSIGSPGNDPYVITVGASNNYLSGTRGDDLVATYSSRGPTYLDHVVKPDVLAPGNRTISLRAVGSPLDVRYPGLRVKWGEYNSDPNKATLDSSYFRLSGTSMSAAVVSGVAALLLQKEPTITPDTVKMRLMKSAEKRPDYDIFTEGAGFVDLLAALQTSGTASGPALSPLAVWTEDGIRIEGSGILIGDGAIWGGRIVWTSDALGITGAVWGGGGIVWANSAVWGTNSVWENSVDTSQTTGLEGDNTVWGDDAPPVP